MKVDSYKTTVITLTDHDAWILEQILFEYKNAKKDTKTFDEFASKMLTDLSKENVKKI